MIETPLYIEIESEYPQAKIYLWPFHQITEDCRLHYQIVEDKNGFHFCAVNSTGHVTYDGKTDKIYPDNQWENETTTAEVLLHGCAYYDGLRHLYFGTEKTKNHAYFYYPDMDLLFLIMNKLIEMEKEHCSMPVERKYIAQLSED